jgi:dihydrofolate reductase
LGGAEIAKLFLTADLLSEFLLTKVHNIYKGDTIFPLDLLQDWSCQTIKKDKNFTIYKYFKKNP